MSIRSELVAMAVSCPACRLCLLNQMYGTACASAFSPAAQLSLILSFLGFRVCMWVHGYALVVLKLSGMGLPDGVGR